MSLEPRRPLVPRPQHFSAPVVEHGAGVAHAEVDLPSRATGTEVDGAGLARGLADAVADGVGMAVAELADVVSSRAHDLVVVADHARGPPPADMDVATWPEPKSTGACDPGADTSYVPLKPSWPSAL